MMAQAVEEKTAALVRRPVKALSALSLREVTPTMADTAMPVFEAVDPATLLVDDGYQRQLSERSIALIRKIVGGWDWRKFKPPVVARTAEGLEVIDGQHTAIAAASHPSIATIPVMVVEAANQTDRAGAFIGHNRDRLNITPMQMHHAAVRSGDEDALTIDQVCQRAGVKILRTPPGSGAFKPAETVAVAGISALIGRRGAMAARIVLQALAEARLAPINVVHIKAVEALLHDAEYRDEVAAADITTALIALGGAAEQEAKVFAATHKVPIWRALAITLFKKARRGRRRSS